MCSSDLLASYGIERSWPLLQATFTADGAWLVRCSILSALAEQPEIKLTWLLELAQEAITDGDGTVRVSGAEILGRIVRDGTNKPVCAEARALLQPWWLARLGRVPRAASASAAAAAAIFACVATAHDELRCRSSAL